MYTRWNTEYQALRTGTAYARMLLCLLTLGANPIVSLAATVSPEPSRAYIIILASAPGAKLDWRPADSTVFENRRLFVTQTIENGKARERLNLGYFDNRAQADALLPVIRKLYPGAWISRDVPVGKRFLSAAAGTGAAPDRGSTIEQAGAHARPSDEQIENLMTRAKSDFSRKKYPEAIRLFTAVVQAGSGRYSQEALELLGLSRQRNGQKSHAFDLYTRYLEKYPDGEGSKRVRQRLSALMTETSPPRAGIRMSSEKAAAQTISYGSWSQYYRRDTASTSDTGTITVNSQLLNFLDLTAISNDAALSHKGRFTADDSYDFLDSANGNEFRFIEMYYEMAYRATGSSMKLGRQSHRFGGILKRFDGISVGYQFTPQLRLNLLAGHPVEIDNKSSINSDKKFYGVSFETGTFLDHWNMNFFHFHQYVFDIDDATSTGFDLRYTDGTGALYGMVDYDYLYRVFNFAQLNANLNLPGGRSLYMNAFMRRSPLLTSSNALIGRPETSIAELEQTLSIEQIRQLALDRTANSRTVTVGGSQPVSEKFRLTGDITLSRVDSTIASGGVDAVPGTGTDYFFSAQLVGNSLFIERDTGVLGLRYLQTDPSDTLSLIVNSRFPITRNWRVNPRIQYDIRKLADGRSQNKWRTLIRTDYRYPGSVRFDFEIGYDDTSQTIDGESLGSSALYFMLGYRRDF